MTAAGRWADRIEARKEARPAAHPDPAAKAAPRDDSTPAASPDVVRVSQTVAVRTAIRAGMNDVTIDAMARPAMNPATNPASTRAIRIPVPARGTTVAARRPARVATIAGRSSPVAPGHLPSSPGATSVPRADRKAGVDRKARRLTPVSPADPARGSTTAAPARHRTSGAGPIAARVPATAATRRRRKAAVTTVAIGPMSVVRLGPDSIDPDLIDLDSTGQTDPSCGRPNA
ncbi:hypothetical protein [Leptothrix discophora]|uniref:Uncharacterized protein n=1 Tax=Leptothrix discophora TaxID=89 RepID=A0ABT9FZ62_LEPDI|nr:hypothetical protein [Leptothrix discophora]MDP4299525.1 hypothetical protein [Leptothrix discophora]